MTTTRLLPTTNERFYSLTANELPTQRARTLATRDHSVIRQWAQKHRAEPATGEATASGGATIGVNDGGAGIRFNFPALGRFRPIPWEEWFYNFDQHRLIFVYEEEEESRAVAIHAYQLWKARGGEHGRDQEDWFEAERQLADRKGGTRYRVVRDEGGWFESLPAVT